MDSNVCSANGRRRRSEPRETASLTSRLLVGTVLSAAVLLACASAQAQDSVAAFYGGRTIPIIIGYPPGGSYDIYARLAAAHMGKYVPGRPSFIVQNKPGGIGVMRSFY
jgi:tripartite-type tricarboxylate transporter receptor subunit TctC